MKNLEGRDSHMWRESLSKQTTLMDTVNRMRDQVKQKSNEVGEKVVRLETLVQDQDFKINSLLKQIEMIQAASFSGGRDSPNGGGGGTGDAGASPYQRESDIKFMRDLIEAERSKRE